jgi:uncharacterized protein (TIGR00255 family)
MIYSMTGYASAARTLARCVLSVELRSVNSRYLDVAFRLPEELRAIESQLRELIGSNVHRGKLECRASLAYLPAAQGLLDLNEGLVQRLAAAGRHVQELVPDARALQVADILRWPGVIGEPDLSLDELGGAARQLIEQALTEFNASRAREGAKLAQTIFDRAARMQVLVQQVAPRVPALVKAYGEKLTARLLEAGLNPDDDRMRQEIVLFASKIDVDEELSRLNAHIKELEHVLARGGAVGRRLDFLMQEFNREANTLGSKSADLESTQVAVELKVLIEQMREQVQNIE